jgi:uncharacterized repeat protein (TIGR02543 family)
MSPGPGEGIDYVYVRVAYGTPTRTGHTFKLWKYTQYGIDKYAVGGDEVQFQYNFVGSDQYKTVTLYAQWQADTYTVSYNAGGGSGAPGNQTKTYGVNLTLSSQTPTWAGHTFSSWNTKADGTGTSYSPGGTYSANAGVTLYAIWTTNSYTVSYNANGGSGAPANQTKYYGTPLALSQTVPTRTNYRFVKWNTKADGTGTSYSPGATYTGNANLPLYAIWELSTFTVTYDANGHGTAPAPQTKEAGDSVAIADAITYTGLLMTEWNTNADGTGTSYDPGDTYSADADLTLYAIWTIAQYTVTFDADGGTVSPATKVVTLGSKYGTLPTPTKAGETFYGWFIGDLLITENSIVELDDDATAKASWSIRSQMRVKGSDNSLHTGAVYVKGSDNAMHMAIAYVKGSDGQMHING